MKNLLSFTSQSTGPWSKAQKAVFGLCCSLMEVCKRERERERESVGCPMTAQVGVNGGWKTLLSEP
ncbi:hypothetical protein DPEC_G00197440 [Dallia pectoralis]|uniref:Uncharacterized protein n=1 Tax=Dallia pectoralis TaxID=75939 RepID=A0ACC2G868_DALPE|nr:hypothetical protein DPEC_G00197440 [Dallia pectoralis]